MPTLQELVNGFTLAASAVGAGLAFMAKTWWSREFQRAMESRVTAAIEAKETLLKTWQERLEGVKDAHAAQLQAADQRCLAAEKKVETLTALTPDKIVEQFNSMKSFYEDKLKFLEAKLGESSSSLALKEAELRQLSEQAGTERSLRERVQRELQSHHDEVSFLQEQIAELRSRERVLLEGIELARKEPFRQDFVTHQLKLFAAGRTLVMVQWRNAQEGVHSSVAAYMNAQATAKVEHEQQQEKALAMRAELPPEKGTDT